MGGQTMVEFFMTFSLSPCVYIYLVISSQTSYINTTIKCHQRSLKVLGKSELYTTEISVYYDYNHHLET